jgi:hypothetical protein
MTPTPDESYELTPKLERALELICGLCDDNITPEQFRELEALVCADGEVRRFYVELMHLHAGLHYFASAISEGAEQEIRLDEEEGEGVLEDGASGGMNEMMMMPALTEAGCREFGPAEDPPTAPSMPVRPRQAPQRSPNLRKAAVAAAITVALGLAAHFGPLMSAKTYPAAYGEALPALRARHFVATYELGAKPVWGRRPPHGGRYMAGETLELRGGAVQLRLANNAKLSVEGPATVRFIGDGDVRLIAGRAVANCPGGGLVIRCPNGNVTDLGTEFGVAVDPELGTSDVEVFEGHVSAALATDARSGQVQPTVLKAGQAVVMSADAITATPSGASQQHFIRNLANEHVTSLDLPDLISGGDGTTHRRGTGIDATTGRIGVDPPVASRTGDGAYHRVTGFPVVDGAFVPDGTSGPMTVDSAGHQFKFIPTSRISYNQIWTGGTIPWPDHTGISYMIGGVDYSTKEHSILCTHSNNAVTLDLNALRRMYPDRAVVRFRSGFANSYINGWHGAAKVDPVTSVLVLVDGVARYENPHFTNRDGLLTVDVRLAESDRFLTLACTDAGTEIDRGWLLWTDAKIELAAAK